MIGLVGRRLAERRGATLVVDLAKVMLPLSLIGEPLGVDAGAEVNAFAPGRETFCNVSFYRTFFLKPVLRFHVDRMDRGTSFSGGWVLIQIETRFVTWILFRLNFPACVS